MSKSRAIVETETKVETIRFYLMLNFFKKKQNAVWNQSLSFIFCLIFEEKYFSHYIPFSDQISFSDYLYILRCWAMCIAFVCYPVCDVIKFEIDLNIFQRDQKSQDKI